MLSGLVVMYDILKPNFLFSLYCQFVFVDGGLMPLEVLSEQHE